MKIGIALIDPYSNPWVRRSYLCFAFEGAEIERGGNPSWVTQRVSGGLGHKHTTDSRARLATILPHLTTVQDCCEEQYYGGYGTGNVGIWFFLLS